MPFVTLPHQNDISWKRLPGGRCLLLDNNPSRAASKLKAMTPLAVQAQVKWILTDRWPPDINYNKNLRQSARDQPTSIDKHGDHLRWPHLAAKMGGGGRFYYLFFASAKLVAKKGVIPWKVKVLVKKKRRHRVGVRRKVPREKVTSSHLHGTLLSEKSLTNMSSKRTVHFTEEESRGSRKKSHSNLA